MVGMRGWCGWLVRWGARFTSPSKQASIIAHLRAALISDWVSYRFSTGVTRRGKPVLPLLSPFLSPRTLLNRIPRSTCIAVHSGILRRLLELSLALAAEHDKCIEISWGFQNGKPQFLIGLVLKLGPSKLPPKIGEPLFLIVLFVAETFLTSRPLSGSRKTGGPLFLSVLFLICRPFFECFFPQKASVSSYCVVPCSWVDIVIRAYQGIINLVVGSIILYKHGKRLLCFVCFHVWTLVAHAAAEPCRSEWLRKDSATSENKSGRYVKTSTDGWLGWWVGGWEEG